MEAEENVMMKQIQATHAPDGREVDVKPLFHLVEDILNRATQNVKGIGPAAQAHLGNMKHRTHHASVGAMLDALSIMTDQISRKIESNDGLGGIDVHAKMVSLFKILSSYSWDAKLVLTLLAFTLNNGEFWLLAQINSSNQLPRSIAILKQLPVIMEHLAPRKPQFDELTNLIKLMLRGSRIILECKELPSMYFGPGAVPVTEIPIAVYWIIRSAVACATQITNLTSMGQEYERSNAEALELSTLANKLKNTNFRLENHLNHCYEDIEEKRRVDPFQMLQNLFQMIHIDNMKILKALIYAKDDPQLLVDGSTKKRVNIDVLRRRIVLLLISDLEIDKEELYFLEQMYIESQRDPRRLKSQYEVVWLPILELAVPGTDSKQTQFDDLQAKMPWHTVHNPSLIDRPVIQFIKEVWRFRKKPILVVLDPQGRVVSSNAIHMVSIWGSLAYPFTALREEALWKGETWGLELLMNDIDPLVLNWISEGRFICIYGGENMEWIRKFTTTARAVGQAAGISMEMVYVGKSNPKRQIQRNIATITAEKLSHSLQDLNLIRHFWCRIESMWHSKMQLGKTIESDPIMQEIMKIRSFDGSFDDGWALLSKGSAEMMTKAKGNTFFTCLTQYEQKWKGQAQQKGFIPALQDHLQQLHTPYHCNQLAIPSTSESIPEKLVCPECERMMYRVIMYECCDE